MPSSLTKVLSPTSAPLCHPTSVGLRYGRSRHSPDGFSRPPRPGQVALTEVAAPPRAFSPHGATPQARALSSRHAQPAARGPHPLPRAGSGAGILTGCPSPPPVGFGLGPPNPPRMTLPEEPSGYRWADFSSAVALLMPAFALPVAPPPLPRWLPRGRERSPTTPARHGPGSAASVDGLAPLHCRRPRTRPVSYYALFEGRLLLSQPPGCLRARTSFPTEPSLRDLSWRSGLFPSRRRSLAPAVSLLPPGRGIRSLAGVGKRSAPSPNQRSTSAARPAETLPLKAFRGEPAISAFAWHFTPTHSSSQGFATPAGSALQSGLADLRPGHG